jgi:nitrite transporter NirC
MFETFGIAKGAISWLDVLRLFAIVWTGNLAGSVLLTFLFAQAGGGVVFSSGTFLHDLVAKKEGAAFLPLLCKAILCNWLVCMAIWLGARLENEMAKMIGMAWCVAAFVACGFEHAVANMTAVSLGLFAPHPTGDLLAAAYNLSVVSLGNLIGGGGFVAAAYLWSSHGERAAAAPAPATVPQSAGAAVPGGLTPAMA